MKYLSNNFPYRDQKNGEKLSRNFSGRSLSVCLFSLEIIKRMPSGLVYREAVKDLFVKDLQYTEYFLQPNMKFNATSVIFLCIGSLNLHPPSRLKKVV